MNVFKGQDIEVVFGGGTYDFDKSSTLTSGKDAVKVTYTAKEGGEVVFRGAKDLDSSKFQKVSDEAILSRIPESSRDNVYCMDISDISESFDGHTTGYYGPDGIGYYELIKKFCGRDAFALSERGVYNGNGRIKRYARSFGR